MSWRLDIRAQKTLVISPRRRRNATPVAPAGIAAREVFAEALQHTTATKLVKAYQDMDRTLPAFIAGLSIEDRFEVDCWLDGVIDTMPLCFALYIAAQIGAIQ